MSDDNTHPPAPVFTFDLENVREPMLGTTDIAAEFARLTGRRAPHIGAVRRLLMTGSHGVVLPSLMVGGRRLSTRSAILWFIARTTEAASRGRPRQAVAASAPLSAPRLTSREKAVLQRAGVLPVEA